MEPIDTDEDMIGISMPDNPDRTSVTPPNLSVVLIRRTWHLALIKLERGVMKLAASRRRQTSGGRIYPAWPWTSRAIAASARSMAIRWWA